MSMDKEIIIAPSLLSADFANLSTGVDLCLNHGANVLHIDVMDGHFVPNITIGPPVVDALNKYTDMKLDCHLMIEKPELYIEKFVKAGADYISVHAECQNHLHRTLSLISSFGIKAGVALNPITPIEYAFEAAEYCDFIMLMSVNPGFGGQKFINSYHRRASSLREYLVKNGLDHVDIEVDGGVKIENVEDIVRSGANMLVSGSGLFKGDFADNISKFRTNAEKGLL